LTLSAVTAEGRWAGPLMTIERPCPPTSSADACARVLAAGKLSWPTLNVDAKELTAYLLERGVTPETLTQAIAADLFLAFACFVKVPSAVQLFQTTYDRIVVAAAKRLDASGSLADELRQRVSEQLFVGSAAGAPKIGEYRGRGPLSAWLRTCAKRIALRLVKTHAPEVLMTREALADEISDVCDQELSLLKEHYGELFRQELVLALNELPARDRMLLQLHLVAGLTTTRIAKMYHLNQSSISRQLQRAAATIFTLVKQRIHTRLGVGTAELESLLDLARSHIELTLSTMDEALAEDQPVGERT
jgi:RNA polymerase sigma-70 factor, ECF subfamily